MESMDKGLTLSKWELIVWPKIPQMPQNLSAQFVCPSPNDLDFNEKRLNLTSVLRAVLESDFTIIQVFFQISVSPNENEVDYTTEKYDQVAENITDAENSIANYLFHIFIYHKLVHGKKCLNDSDCAFTSYCEINIDSANSSSSDGKFTVSSIGYAKY